MTDQDRKNIEDMIDREEAALQECVHLIKERVPLMQWPLHIRSSFLLAIRLDDGSREAHKAHIMARHLRIDRDLLDFLPMYEKADSVLKRCAERIRADLTHLVRLGEGRYIMK